MMDVRAFIERYRISASSTRVDSNPNAPDWRDADHWKVVLTARYFMPPRRLTCYFSMGYGHKGAKPKPYDVLTSLRLDADAAEQDFESWASDLGFDTDSRRAEQTYKACRKIAKRLQSWLGDPAFSHLLSATDEG